MIVFTGGGSGGHSVVAMTLIEYFQNQDPSLSIKYIGSHTGIEKKLAKENKIDYFAISTGKLRRYLSFENLIDIFKVLKSFLDCLFLYLGPLRKSKVIFSTGGFVSVAPCLVGKIFGKKVFLHEQTSRLGLANKIVSKVADKIFISFEESQKFLAKEKTVFSGYPLRAHFENEIAQSHTLIKDLDLNKLEKPLLFVTGGGNGAQIINALIAKHKDELLDNFIVFHQVGKKFYEKFLKLETNDYKVFSFIGQEMIDILKRADVIVSRAGAGAVSEMIFLNKSVLFIPLKIAQRNEQFFNAKEAVNKIGAKLVEEDQLDSLDLSFVLQELLGKDESLRINKKKNVNNSSKLIYQEVFHVPAEVQP